MPLLSCAECAAQISDTALRCPQCGSKTKFSTDLSRAKEIRRGHWILWPIVLWGLTIDLVAAIAHWIKGGIDPVTCLMQSMENKVGLACNLMKLDMARWSAEASKMFDQNKWMFWVWVACFVIAVAGHIESHFVRKRIGDRKP